MIQISFYRLWEKVRLFICITWVSKSKGSETTQLCIINTLQPCLITHTEPCQRGSGDYMQDWQFYFSEAHMQPNLVLSKPQLRMLVMNQPHLHPDG